jgi:hypothetical protein
MRSVVINSRISNQGDTSSGHMFTFIPLEKQDDQVMTQSESARSEVVTVASVQSNRFHCDQAPLPKKYRRCGGKTPRILKPCNRSR